MLLRPPSLTQACPGISPALLEKLTQARSDLGKAEIRQVWWDPWDPCPLQGGGRMRVLCALCLSKDRGLCFVYLDTPSTHTPSTHAPPAPTSKHTSCLPHTTHHIPHHAYHTHTPHTTHTTHTTHHIPLQYTYNTRPPPPLHHIRLWSSVGRCTLTVSGCSQLKKQLN